MLPSEIPAGCSGQSLCSHNPATATSGTGCETAAACEIPLKQQQCGGRAVRETRTETAAVAQFFAPLPKGTESFLTGSRSQSLRNVNFKFQAEYIILAQFYYSAVGALWQKSGMCKVGKYLNYCNNRFFQTEFQQVSNIDKLHLPKMKVTAGENKLSQGHRNKHCRFWSYYCQKTMKCSYLFVKCKKKKIRYSLHTRVLVYRVSGLIDLLLSVHLTRRSIHTILQF